ncbi:MAG: transposase, partial [Thermomicrobiales bacterium]|nr:transposase [Thermomicrobiales bacterium]
FVFAPLLGLALDRIVLGKLSKAPAYARIVGTIGILVALPNLVQWLVDAVMVDWLGLNLTKLSEFGDSGGLIPPGIGPTPPKVCCFGWPGLDNVNLNSNQLAVFIVAAIVAALLYVVIRRTRVGLEMRAQVDRESLAALRGINPRRTSGIAWMLSMTLAGLGGVLIAPLFQLNDPTYLFVVFASLAAVAIAGMRSIPLAFAAGLGLGVVQNLIAGYKRELFPKFLSSLSGLESAVPYVILLVALFIVGRERGRAAGTVSDEKPAPDHRAGLPSWRRKLPWAIITVVLVLYTLGAFPWPNNPYFVRSSVLAPGLALSIIFLSFVVVTGIGGMVSLAQATFVTAGGYMAGWALQLSDAPHPPPWASWSFDVPFFVHNGQMNFLAACLLGAVVAAVLGALVAYPIRRMGTLALALATFARDEAINATHRVGLVLDQAGWHTSPQVTLPAGLDLVFLPPYSPELAPAERLWPLLDEVVVNRTFADLDALEAVRVPRCQALTRQRPRLKSLTRYHWWPRERRPRRTQ